MFVPNFTTSLNNNNKLVLKDTSSYDGVTVTNRYWLIVDAEGNTTEILSPIVNGTGDETVISDIDRDMSLSISVAYNYIPSTGESTYLKSKNVLYSPVITEILYDIRKVFVDTLLDKDKEPEYDKLLNDIEMIDAYNEASINLLSTDLKGSQLALDMGNDYANEYKGKI